VPDLNISIPGNNPVLTFSGDQTLNYTIQSSSNLLQWNSLGSPAYVGNGSFSMADFSAGGVPARYYRVIASF
jgi:hypothetical protein